MSLVNVLEELEERLKNIRMHRSEAAYVARYDSHLILVFVDPQHMNYQGVITTRQLKDYVWVAEGTIVPERLAQEHGLDYRPFYSCHDVNVGQLTSLDDMRVM